MTSEYKRIEYEYQLVTYDSQVENLRSLLHDRGVTGWSLQGIINNNLFIFQRLLFIESIHNDQPVLEEFIKKVVQQTLTEVSLETASETLKSTL